MEPEIRGSTEVNRGRSRVGPRTGLRTSRRTVLTGVLATAHRVMRPS